MKIFPIIMAGGQGSRLSPASRPDRPKPFLKLLSDQSLLQKTILRLKHDAFEPPVIIGHRDHKDLIEQHSLGVNSAIVLEPGNFGTAYTIALGARYALEQDPGAVIAVMPCDHYIEDTKTFQQTIIEAAEQAGLIALGVKPKTPHTGYGYIQIEEEKVLSFKEKPDEETAQSYFNSGGYLWNAGIFVFKAETILEEIKTYTPAVYEAAQSHATCDPISIDYAVLEKTDRLKAIELKTGWRDIGTWRSVWEIAEEQKIGKIVNRPWGYYTILAKGPDYVLKSLTVKPHSALSLQYHNHRSEHWVVMDGQVEILCDEEYYTLQRDNIIDIGIGERHRLMNKTDHPAYLIEVQMGEHISEDDIVRLDDRYERVS